MLAPAASALTVALASSGSIAWSAPIVESAGDPPRLTRAFHAPSGPYAAGHRGVDLSSRVGAHVRSASPGRVAYAGLLAGRPVVAVHYRHWRISYEPVRPAVAVGAIVTAGQHLGTLAAGTHCRVPCLHWGVREAGRYVNPWRLVAGRVRLLPAVSRFPGVSQPADGPVPPADTGRPSRVGSGVPAVTRPYSPPTWSAPSGPPSSPGPRLWLDTGGLGAARSDAGQLGAGGLVAGGFGAGGLVLGAAVWPRRAGRSRRPAGSIRASDRGS